MADKPRSRWDAGLICCSLLLCANFPTANLVVRFVYHVGSHIHLLDVWVLCEPLVVRGGVTKVVAR